MLELLVRLYVSILSTQLVATCMQLQTKAQNLYNIAVTMTIQ